MPISTLPRPFYVRTIDLSLYRTDPLSSEVEQVVERVREACLFTEFSQLINHGLENSAKRRV